VGDDLAKIDNKEGGDLDDFDCLVAFGAGFQYLLHLQCRTELRYAATMDTAMSITAKPTFMGRERSFGH
jgi:hypothetical protein